MLQINEEKYNTFILCLYVNSFFISVFFKNFGIRVPIVPLLFLLSLFIGIRSIYLKKSLLLSSVFIIIISINLIISNKVIPENTLIYYIKMLILMIIAIYFTNIKISIEEFGKYMKILIIPSSVVSLYLIENKFLYQKLNLDYMSWGYPCLIITLIAAYLFNVFLEYKYLLITFILNIMIFLYGSRFNFLLGVLGSSLLLYFSEDKNIKKIYQIGSIFLIFIFFNLEKILKVIINFLIKSNISTISVQRLYNTLIMMNKGNGIIGPRIEWYKETLKLIEQFPVFGTGILGWMNKIPSKLYNGNWTFYPHNIFLEILMHFGIIGLVIFFIVIFLIIRKIYIQKKNGYKIDKCYLIFIILSLKLLLSSSYLFENWFWFVLIIPFNDSYYLSDKVVKYNVTKDKI